MGIIRLFKPSELITMSTELITALQNPTLYPHPIDKFEVIETHISWVILTGHFAYKIKKPMDFGFLNFTQLADRRLFCEKELALNQRLVKDLYLEVLPITGTVHNPSFSSGGEPIEYALKMRQFPQSQLLSQLQLRGELTVNHIDQLAELIAEFHLNTPKALLEQDYGTPEKVMEPIVQNFEQIRAMLPEDKRVYQQLAALEEWATTSYERLYPLLSKRKQQGFIRECHGDIHLNNAAILDDKVILFDCIEFNESFRMTDVMADIAFLVMDLEDRKLGHLANRLINNYLEKTGDYEALPLINFYKSYRAMVRAKVALFSYGQTTSEQARQAILMQYYNYANLAESYTSIPARYLMVTHGVSGIGKSYISSKIVEQLGAIRFRSDVERKRLYADDPLIDDLYSTEATQKTYQVLQDLAMSALQVGYSVVLDAAFLKHRERQQMLQVAEHLAVPFLILDCQASLDSIEKNIATRARQGTDPSDATLEVMRKQLQWKESLTDAEKSVSYVINTQQEDSLSALMAYLK